MIVEGDEHRRIVVNLLTIRNYIKSKFPGYTLTEHSVTSLYHEFTVTNEKLHKRYTLKVNWSRLSNRRNTPERTWASLTSGFVASSMVRADHAFYSW